MEENQEILPQYKYICIYDTWLAHWKPITHCRKTVGISPANVTYWYEATRIALVLATKDSFVSLVPNLNNKTMFVNSDVSHLSFVSAQCRKHFMSHILTWLFTVKPRCSGESKPSDKGGGGGRSYRPWNKRGGEVSRKPFLVLRAPVWSKNKGEPGPPGPSPGSATVS